MRGTLGGYEHRNIEKTGKYSNIEKKLPDTEILQYQVESQCHTGQNNYSVCYLQLRANNTD